eukprot:362446-Chlamydomonas_euryale.AAC.3
MGGGSAGTCGHMRSMSIPQSSQRVKGVTENTWGGPCACPRAPDWLLLINIMSCTCAAICSTPRHGAVGSAQSVHHK